MHFLVFDYIEFIIFQQLSVLKEETRMLRLLLTVSH